jgi:hypothetical protein
MAITGHRAVFEMERQYAAAAEAKAEKRDKYGDTPSEELAAKVAQLEAELGVQQSRTLHPTPIPPELPHPQSQPRGPERWLLGPPPPPEPEKKIAPAPDPNMPEPASLAHCDEHGAFALKSRMDPVCPACRKQWEAQSKADEKRLASLLPGEPGWSWQRR